VWSTHLQPHTTASKSIRSQSKPSAKQEARLIEGLTLTKPYGPHEKLTQRDDPKNCVHVPSHNWQKSRWMCRSLARSEGIPGSGVEGGEGRGRNHPRMKSRPVKSSKRSAKASVAQTRPEDGLSTAWSMSLPPRSIESTSTCTFFDIMASATGKEPGYESTVC